MKDVKQYFKEYPTRKECYQTSDDFIFHEDHDARAHAHSLRDKEIQHHKKKGAPVTDGSDGEPAKAPKASKAPKGNGGVEETPDTEAKGGKKASQPK